MNRLYGLVIATLLCFITFIGLALADRLQAPLPGKEIRLALDTDPPTLDPISIADTYSDGVASKIYSKLVCLRLKDDKLEICPDAAEALPAISSDGRIYTFK